MKRNTAIILAICFAAVAAVSVKSQQQPQSSQRQQPGVVIIEGTVGIAQPYHFEVYGSSSGPKSPKLVQGEDLAAAIEGLMDQGYRLHSDPAGWMFVMIRE